MAELSYLALMSADGYIEDAAGSFGWAEPDEEVHSFVNELVRPVGTYLYGRRMYEVMAVWDDPETAAGEPPCISEFAEIWKAADKVVYSKTLESASTARTRIEREFDAQEVEALKSVAPGDFLIGGPELAGHAARAGLIDECHLFLAPIFVGQGKPALPDDLRLELELLDERSIRSGFVVLRYRTRS